jgi:putative copper resistance protein D
MIPLALVWLRGAGLVGQALALGGALFALLVVRPSGGDRPGGRGNADQPLHRAHERVLFLVLAGVALTAFAQAGVLSALAAGLAEDGGWPLDDLLASTVGVAGGVRLVAAGLAAAAALAYRRAPEATGRGALLLAATVVLSCTGALASHAIGRVEGRLWLWSLSALHQAAAGAWIGGLVSAALLGLRASGDSLGRWLRRFSRLAAGAVTVLAVTGAALALEYVGTAGAAVGTSYGAMVLTKLVLFATLLAMGWRNHRALGRERLVPAALLVRRRLEVEAGLGVVTLFLAASIGSAAPAVDVVVDRATPEEVRRIFTPRWPSWQTPSAAELAASSALADRWAPRTAENTAWSEFGHHVAGVFVLAMGLLATLERTGKAPWARHWPLLIIALTGFVAWSVDPEGWQTGTVGFWEQLWDPEVLQHRVLLVLTGLFGLAEWRLRGARHAASMWRFVFPLVAIWGGVLLISHVHVVNNAKSAFFMELTHLPLGLVSLLVGWNRWLELRLAPAPASHPGRLWAPALAVFGLILIFYREG